MIIKGNKYVKLLETIEVWRVVKEDFELYKYW